MRLLIFSAIAIAAEYKLTPDDRKDLKIAETEILRYEAEARAAYLKKDALMVEWCSRAGATIKTCSVNTLTGVVSRSPEAPKAEAQK
jgi:hypothetical protein